VGFPQYPTKKLSWLYFLSKNFLTNVDAIINQITVYAIAPVSAQNIPISKSLSSGDCEAKANAPTAEDPIAIAV